MSSGSSTVRKSIVIKTIKSFDLKVKLSRYFDILVNMIKHLSSSRKLILFPLTWSISQYIRCIFTTAIYLEGVWLMQRVMQNVFSTESY